MKTIRTHLTVAFVALAILATAGVSHAQNDGLPTMPAKVRAFLDGFVGTWTYDGSFKGRATIQWDAGKGCLIAAGQEEYGGGIAHWTELIHWDGTSPGGIVISSHFTSGQAIAHSSIHGEIVSSTAMVGKKTAVRFGQTDTADVRISLKGKDGFVSQVTNVVVGGKKEPDETFVFSKVTPTSLAEEALEAAMGWGAARERKDIAYIDRLLADDLTCVDPDGGTAGKAQLMALCKSDDFKSVSHAYDLDARVYGNTAVVTGLLTSKQYYKDQDWSGTIRLTETYVKRDGQWQCVATHASNAGKTANAPAETIEGLWSIQTRTVNGTPENRKNRKSLKFYQDGTFLFVHCDASTGKIEMAGAGGYTFDGKTLRETLDFINIDDYLPYRGVSFDDHVRFEGDTFHQSGTRMGATLEERWQRVTPK